MAETHKTNDNGLLQVNEKLSIWNKGSEMLDLDEDE
jgi:hypothetical protein